MYNIYNIVEAEEVIYVGYSRFSCEELKENMEKYKEYTVCHNTHQVYMYEKGIDKFEYRMICTAEDESGARVLRKKYIEEYNPRLNPQRERKEKQRKEGGPLYFYRGGRLMIIMPKKEKPNGAANSVTDVQMVQSAPKEI